MRPIVLLHGFTGRPASWDDVVAGLPLAQPIVRLALLGHSRAPVDIASFEAEVDRLAFLVPPGAHLCGYSMGARVALGILARHPGRAASATLIGVHPGFRDGDAAERTARAAADERWARLCEEQGIARFAAAWEDQPLFATQSAAQRAAQRAERLRHEPAGLARALRTLGLARMPEYWTFLAATRLPVRLVCGEHDAKFRDLAARTGHPGHVVPGAGHNVPLEHPTAIAALLYEGSQP